MEKYHILGLHLTDRTKHAAKVQEVLSEYACYIKTRIGLHEVKDNLCSTNGVVLLQIIPDEKILADFKGKLDAIEGVETKDMVF